MQQNTPPCPTGCFWTTLLIAMVNLLTWSDLAWPSVYLLSVCHYQSLTSVNHCHSLSHNSVIARVTDAARLHTLVYVCDACDARDVCGEVCVMCVVMCDAVCDDMCDVLLGLTGPS